MVNPQRELEEPEKKKREPVVSRRELFGRENLETGTSQDERIST
jgi:hypothetical protein